MQQLGGRLLLQNNAFNLCRKVVRLSTDNTTDQRAKQEFEFP